ncbi:MAG: SIMPL domain-containing protein [Bacteroidaceae bacterium]|nr:SIMPL domain-containing protein [Bacteroidaceae bacterium]
MKEACIVAAGLVLGLVALGCCLKSGIDNFTNRDRKVTVKGLAEQIVEADKVTWPIQTKEIGNDLPSLYTKINATTAAVKAFLLKYGVKENEISMNAPTVIDLNAERYGENNRNYRYNITSTITVVSNNVKLIRDIMTHQGELLQQDIAIVDGGYEAPIRYEFVVFKDMKPKMMREAIENAELTAQQFAENSHSLLNKIVSADQGQFSIEDRDENTPYIKKVRVVTTVTYSLKN